MKLAVVVLLVVLAVLPAHCVIKSHCELKKELEDHLAGLTDQQRRTLGHNFVIKSVCGARKTSNLNTTLVTPKGDSQMYGIFQLQGQLVCSDGTNICQISCNDLIDDDTQDDIGCLVKIMSKVLEKPFAQEVKALSEMMRDFYMGGCAEMVPDYFADCSQP